MKKQGVFVTGTDTGVGKTLVSAVLVAALARAGRKPGYFKPVQTGQDSDTATVRELASRSEAAIQAPSYSFPDPMAPSRAAACRGETIRLDRIATDWGGMSARSWIIEGAGGLLVPLNRKETVRDLIACLNVPAVLVASTRLGTINHTLLTLEALKRYEIPFAGLALNGNDDPGLLRTLRDFFEIPAVFSLPRLSRLSADVVEDLAAEVFKTGALEALFPIGSRS